MVSASQKVIEFCQKFKIKEFQPKNTLVAPNVKPENFYFLEEGFVRNFISTKEGNELSINIFSGKTFLPFTPLWNESCLSCFFYETIGRVNLRIIPNKDIFAYAKANNNFLEEFTSLYIANINLMIEKTKELIYHDTNYRIIATIIELAKDLGCPERNNLDFKINLSQELIASFAGTTRETVTRKLAELKTRGLIAKNYNSLKIVQLKELENLITLQSV